MNKRMIGLVLAVTLCGAAQVRDGPLTIDPGASQPSYHYGPHHDRNWKPDLPKGERPNQ